MTKWISVKKKKPPQHTDVLCCIPWNGGIFISRRSGSKYFTSESMMTAYPEYWMPLPDLPKEGDE